MRQETLFDAVPTNPIAHTDDPATSHEAGERVTLSGRRGAHARMVLALVRAHPGLTAIELWAIAASEAEQRELREPQEVRRRCTDLLHSGEVRQGEARRCSVRGSRMVTWYAAQTGE
jgi:hypothetical protein